MKVCHLTSVHHFKDTRIFIKECQSLTLEKYEVSLIAPNAPNQEINKVQVYGISNKTNSRLLRMINTVGKVYQKAKKVNADIYHFHDPELIPVGLLLKLRRKKVVYDVHEDVPRQIMSKRWIKKPLRKIVSWFFERLENFAAKRFDGIVTATPFINKRFKKFNNNSINVNNYPILGEFHPNNRWKEKEEVVCYIGGITKARGIIEMVEAVGKTSARLLLGGKYYYKQDQKEAHKMGGWDKVEYLGYLDRKEIANALSRSMAGLVVLHPTLNFVDALPVKMFEYMSAGIAVIASDFPLWKEIIDENRCGICVNPLEPDEIAKAIQWIIDHPEEARLLGENARKAIEEKYNWENESKKLLNLYESLIMQDRKVEL